MSITPADIQQQRFSEARKGYNPGEVDVFLESIAGEVDAMLRKIADLKGRLNNAEKQLAQAQTKLAQAPQQAPQQLPQATQTSSYGATEQQISAALITAQQSADRIVEEAQSQARVIRDEAEGKAREVIKEALAEKQTELDEIERLKQSREDFRNEYVKLVQHFMDDAKNTFPASIRSASRPSGSEARQDYAETFDPQKTVLAQAQPAPVEEEDDLD